MSPGARDGWGLYGSKCDKETALSLALESGSVTTFSAESQCHSAMGLHPKREAAEKLSHALPFCTSHSCQQWVLEIEGIPEVHKEEKRDRNWEKANIFSQTQGLGTALNSVISQICMTKHNMT